MQPDKLMTDENIRPGLGSVAYAVEKIPRPFRFAFCVKIVFLFSYFAVCYSLQLKCYQNNNYNIHGISRNYYIMMRFVGKYGNRIDDTRLQVPINYFALLPYSYFKQRFGEDRQNSKF